jgi:hypothetical protein
VDAIERAVLSAIDSERKDYLPTDAEVLAWLDRHNRDGSMSIEDARCMIEDARTMHAIAASKSSDPANTGDK